MREIISSQHHTFLRNLSWNLSWNLCRNLSWNLALRFSAVDLPVESPKKPFNGNDLLALASRYYCCRQGWQGGTP